MDINKTKLADLRDYFLKGGSTETTDILEHLETKDEEIMQAYIAALKTTYPDDFGPKKKKPSPSPVTPPAPAPELAPRFFLKDALTGLVTELEVTTQKNYKTTLVVKEPKDLVEIVIRGEVTTIDLVQLNKLPDTAEHLGVSVLLLKGLAAIAKA